MMKLKLIIAAILLTGLITSSKLKIGTASSDNTVSDTIQNPLFLYGKYIYRRENCSDCHKLEMDDSSKLISLDGFKGSHPDVWVYNFLSDPKSMQAWCPMPPFEFLKSRDLDFTTFKRSYPEVTENYLRERWKLLNELSDSIIVNQSELSYLLGGKTEFLALTYFVQNIPSSRSRYIKDSIAKAKTLLIKTQYLKDLEDPQWQLYRWIDSADKGMISNGERLFRSHCIMCHSMTQETVGPNLGDKEWICGNSNKAIAKSILMGSERMPPFFERLSLKNVAEIMAFLRKRK